MSTGGSFFDFHERLTAKRPPAGRAAPTATAAPAGPVPLTVSQLTHQIDGVLRAGFPGTVQVRGEVSNCKPHAASGHCYFTLKDAKACLNCVMWRSDAAKLRFQPRDGMELLATGTVGVYGQQGRYQLYVNRLEPLGQGALELAFQQLRQKLERAGLFDAARKKRIPPYPRRIALVTSAGAAALQDMLKVLRRCPWIKLFLYPVPVQGDGAAEKIAAALDHLGRCHDAAGGVDAILLARGGGSLEDLWAFNEEVVARAVFASPIPVISGIGHEVDVSIADLVADHHAHTPTEAAQTVIQYWKHARDDLDQYGIRLRRELRSVVSDARHRLQAVERHESFRRPLARINGHRQFLDDQQRQMSLAITERLRLAERRVGELQSRLEAHRPQNVIARLRQRVAEDEQRLVRSAHAKLRTLHDRLQRVAVLLRECHPRHQAKLEEQRLTAFEARLHQAIRLDQRRRVAEVTALSAQLEALSPQRVLARGYSMTMIQKTGVVVRDAAQLKSGDRIETRFASGSAVSTVDDPRQLPLFE
jgi:exodeoxyribonuclease VII large subunit